MTQNNDLNVMTNDRENPQEHRDDLEHRMKDLFIWALGESVITEMTRTARDKDPNKMETMTYIHCSGYISYRNGMNSIAELISAE